jgi:hypothetical protein
MKKTNPIANKVVAPSVEEIHNAINILSDWKLSVYQALCEYGLTDANGYKMFIVEGCQYRGSPTYGIRVKVNGNDDGYDFSVQSGEEAIGKAMLVVDAIKAGKQKISHRACCPLAEFLACVCLESFSCPLHGSSHFGTHD